MSKVVITTRVNTAGMTKIQGAVAKDCAAALYLEAELIMTDSKQNYVPVDTGNLKNSGVVLAPTITGNKVSVVLGYGGSAAPYAATVHEYPKAYGQHKNKYLQRPINAAAKGMSSRIASTIRRSVSMRGGNP